eukprot:g9112.t4
MSSFLQQHFAHRPVLRDLACGLGFLGRLDVPSGRKHQIRIHLTQQGHPVVNDMRFFSKLEVGRFVPMSQRCPLRVLLRSSGFGPCDCWRMPQGLESLRELVWQLKPVRSLPSHN